MTPTFHGNTLPDNPSGGICDEYRLDTIGSLAELIDTRRQLAVDHPGCLPLFSLDDLPQARYTAGHARNDLELDTFTPLDIAGLPAECFENGEYIGYASTKAEFGLCLRNFMAKVATASFKQACAHGLTLDANGLREWLDYQDRPLALFDFPLSVLLVPVQEPCQALVAFPNGYFECDLSPVHNFAVAHHLAQAYGYELMGVGAAYLGFLREQPADPVTIQAVAADLCALYNVADEQQSAFVAAVSGAITGRTYLWLRYVE